MFTAYPSAPRSPRVSTVGNESLTISWTPPESDGGRSDVYYNIEYRDVCSLEFVRINTNVTTTSYTITGLRPVAEYVIRIIAENGVSSFGQTAQQTGRFEEIPDTVTTGEGGK